MILTSVLDKITLRGRVIGLAVTAMAGLAVVGIAQFATDHAVRRASADYALMDTRLEQLADFDKQVLLLRVAEQALRAERKSAALPQVSDNIDKAAAKLDRLASDYASDPAAWKNDFAGYVASLQSYSSLLAQLGYRDRQTVEVSEEGKAGIDSPSGFTVDLSNATAKLANRVAEELEFDDQPAVFRVALGIDGMHRTISSVISDPDITYFKLVESKIADIKSLLGDEDLDPDFAETAGELLQGLRGPLDQLMAAERELAQTAEDVNSQFGALNQSLSEELKTVFEQASAIRAQMDATQQWWSALILTTVIATFALLGAASLLIVRSVSQSMATITGVTGALADGQTECEIPYTNAHTEIGELARALVVFRDNATERRKLEAHASQEQLEKSRRQDEIEATIAGFKEEIVCLLDTANTAITRSHGTAGDLLAASERNAGQAENADEASGLASENVQMIASATHQLNTSIAELASQVSLTTDQMASVSERAQATNADVDQLAEAATKIDEIILLIQAIAEQTNLLALNATIEAARAGEHGKGFSVVASEVKSLAAQTARATDEISNQIKAIQQSTRATVTSISGIAQTIGDVQQNTTAIAAAIEEQTMATSEISRNIDAAADRTREVAQNVSDLRDTAADTRKSADDIRDASEEFGTVNSRIRSSIDRFLDLVAAA